MNPSDGLPRVHSIYRAITTDLEVPANLIAKIPNEYCKDPRFANPAFVYGNKVSGSPLTTAVNEVIAAHHPNLFAGHFGAGRTVEMVRRPKLHLGYHSLPFLSAQ